MTLFMFGNLKPCSSLSQAINSHVPWRTKSYNLPKVHHMFPHLSDEMVGLVVPKFHSNSKVSFKLEFYENIMGEDTLQSLAPCQPFIEKQNDEVQEYPSSTVFPLCKKFSPILKNKCCFMTLACRVPNVINFYIMISSLCSINSYQLEVI